MIQAILFDLDGTLANTISALREGVNLTMQDLGYPTHTEEDILSYINHGPKELIRLSLPKALQGDEVKIAEALVVYNQRYGEVYHHTDRAYDGMAELVQDLHRTYRIGVLSNKQDAYTRLLSSQVLLPNSYDAAQGGIPGVASKPSRELVDRITEVLGVSPEDCIMVGDSDVDILTARNAGMRHIGVTWGFRDEMFLRANGATNIAHSPEELREMIEKIRKEESER